MTTADLQTKRPLLCVVHCVDTEGPLWESEDATRERLGQIIGQPVPSFATLADLREGKGVPADKRDAVAGLLTPEMMAYNRDWAMIDQMLARLFSPEWRNARRDDFGQDYLFNWFTMDHVGFTRNPRRRAMGYHAIFEHYQSWVERSPQVRDALYWHYHPVSFDFQGHKCSCNFSFTNHHLEVLSRRIIDHLHFPAAFRPGQHTERPDISFFLEMWIPFDYANQATEQTEFEQAQLDISDGRFGDWRRAPKIWGHYNPDLYDYQQPGDMRRYIFRCLNLGSRLRHIQTDDLRDAMRQAQEKGVSVVSVASHDFREMSGDTDRFLGMIEEARRDYPDVAVAYTDAVTAARLEIGLQPEEPLRLAASISGNTLTVTSNKPVWGAQPFLCVRTKDDRYLHENLDYHGGKRWSYTFDDLTLAMSAIDTIGLAANDKLGQTYVSRLQLRDGSFDLEERFWNLPAEMAVHS